METIASAPPLPEAPDGEARLLRREHRWAALVYLLFLSSFLFFVLKNFKTQFIIGMDTDITFPFKWYWIESLKQGDPAFWNPYWALGGPFLAYPTVGAFSPLNIVHFFLTPVMSENVRFVFFYFWAAFGTYLFMRRLGVCWTAGLLSGFAFAFCSQFTSRNVGSAGHPEVWWTFSWAPWILYFMERTLREKRWIFLALASLSWTFAFFEGHPQAAYMSVLVTGFYLGWAFLSGRVGFGKTLKIGLAFVALFLLLSACQFLPTWEFVKLSNRWGMDYNNTITDFLTTKQFYHFISPDFSGFHLSNWVGRWGYHEIVGYIGLAPVFLFVAGFPLLLVSRRHALFFLLAATFLTLTLGDSTFLSKWVHRIFFYAVPGFSQHRSLGRYLMPAALTMACSAGLALDILVKRLSPGRTPWWASLLLAVTVLDLWAYGMRFTYPSGPDWYDVAHYPTGNYVAVLPEAPELIESLKKDPDYPRIKTLYDGHYAMFHKISSITTSGTVYLSNRGVMWQYYNPESFINDLVGVKYSCFRGKVDLDPKHWKKINDIVYENLHPLPRVMVPGGHKEFPNIYLVFDALRDSRLDPRGEIALIGEAPAGLPQQPGPAGSGRITRYTNDAVEMECQSDRAAFCFIADNYFPGWKAWVDGKPAPLLQADGTFRAVPLPGAGTHLVRMEYRPWRIYAGLIVSLIGFALVGLIAWKGRRALI